MKSLHYFFPLLLLIKRLYVMYVILLGTKNYLIFPVLINSNIHLILFTLIHLDVWGPLAIKFNHNHSYCSIVVDDFSRYTWVILMKIKAEIRQNIINFIKMVEVQHKLLKSQLVMNTNLSCQIFILLMELYIKSVVRESIVEIH